MMSKLKKQRAQAESCFSTEYRLFHFPHIFQVPSPRLALGKALALAFKWPI